MVDIKGTILRKGDVCLVTRGHISSITGKQTMRTMDLIEILDPGNSYYGLWVNDKEYMGSWCYSDGWCKLYKVGVI